MNSNNAVAKVVIVFGKTDEIAVLQKQLQLTVAALQMIFLTGVCANVCASSVSRTGVGRNHRTMLRSVDAITAIANGSTSKMDYLRQLKWIDSLAFHGVLLIGRLASVCARNVRKNGAVRDHRIRAESVDAETVIELGKKKSICCRVRIFLRRAFASRNAIYVGMNGVRAL